jgi:hypothetical protein
MRIARVIPGCAPRMAIGPQRACPIGPTTVVVARRRGGGPGGTKVVNGSSPQSASSVRKRMVSPESIVSTGGRSGEKKPCKVWASGSMV